MTKKQYRTAMGKSVDMGALLLQNETVRAVGNMSVNARGDVLDSKNKIIDKKANQVKRQYRRQSGVSTGTPAASLAQVEQLKQQSTEADLDDVFDDLPEDNDVVAETVTNESIEPQLTGGLAAAIARSRTVTQELEKPLNSKPTKIRRI
jgi:hypothetical protein